MTDLQEKAMRLALDALTVQLPEHWLDKELQGNAIQALRQALAQPEQRGHCTCGDPTLLGYVHFRTRPCIYYTTQSAQPKQEPAPGHGKQLHDQLITAIHRLLNAKDEPSSWGQVGPDAFDIAWHQVTALVSHICTAIDSPDTPPSIEAAVLAEREAIMEICNRHNHPIAGVIYHAIRARSEK